MPRTVSRATAVDVDVRVGGDLAGHDHEAGGDQRLARDAALRVLLVDRVEHRVADLVAHLVGVAFGDRLRREGVVVRQPDSLLVLLAAISVQESRHPIEDDVREVSLGEQRKGLHTAVGVEDDGAIRVHLEARVGLRDVVADDEVEALGAQLVGRVLEQVVGLGREPDEHLARGLVAPEVDEEVVGGLEHDLRDPLVLLELAVRWLLRPEVGDRRRHHDDVLRRGPGEHRVLHLRRGLHAHDLDAAAARAGRWW